MMKFRQTTRLPVMVLTIAANLLVFGCSKSPNQESAAGLPKSTNVLLITLDTTRADRLGFYGYKKAATPTLDAQAARGSVFDDAQSIVNLTLPSHATIMTGRYPREHGLRINGQGRLSQEIPTLASLLNGNGYATGAFVSSFVLDDRYGVGRGFTVYDDEMGQPAPGADSHGAERPADAVTQRALKWLESNGGKSFFCWIHYYDAHHPYAPPARFREALDEPYDGELAFIDSEVSRVMGWLTSKGLLDRTLVIVVGDHGESFGEHGEFGHTTFLYETNLRVPLLIAHPALGSAARRITAPVSLVDLFPTVLELLSLPRPEGLLGRSLAPLLRGAELTPRPCYAESDYALRVHGWAQQRALITPEWKYISSVKPELYNRLADRDEKQNLATQRPDVTGAFQSTLAELYAAMTPTAHGQVVRSDDAARRLQSLGYVSGGQRAIIDEVLTPTLADPKDMIDVMMALKKAQRLVEEERHAEAVPVLVDAVNRSPQSADILHQLGRAYLKTDRVDEAITTFQKALELDPDSADALRMVADALLRARRTAEAIKHYEAALEIEPEDPLTRFSLGTAFLTVQDNAKAIAHLREAVRLTPEYGDALVNLGVALAKSGQADEAEAALKQALRTGSNAEAHYMLAQLAMKRSRPAEVEEHLLKALELKPSHRQASDDLTRFYLSNRRPADAVQNLKAAMIQSPDHIGTALTLAEILASSMNDELRDGKEAVRLAEPIVTATKGSDVRALTTLAAAKAETGDFESATQIAEKALGLAEAAADARLMAFIKAQLEAYRTKRPFRNSSF